MRICFGFVSKTLLLVLKIAFEIRLLPQGLTAERSRRAGTGLQRFVLEAECAPGAGDIAPTGTALVCAAFMSAVEMKTIITTAEPRPKARGKQDRLGSELLPYPPSPHPPAMSTPWRLRRCRSGPNESAPSLGSSAPLGPCPPPLCPAATNTATPTPSPRGGGGGDIQSSRHRHRDRVCIGSKGGWLLLVGCFPTFNPGSRSSARCPRGEQLCAAAQPVRSGARRLQEARGSAAARVISCFFREVPTRTK